MKFDWVNRYRKLFFNPTTNLGNPLYKISDVTKQKSFIKDVIEDSEYQNKIQSFYTSPSNVRGLIVGVNSSIVIYHQLPKGGNSLTNIKRMNNLDDIFWDNFADIMIGDGFYQIDGHHFSYTQKVIKDLENAPIIKVPRNPIDVIAKEHPFINLEFIAVTWNAFNPSAIYDDNVKLQSLQQLANTSKRFQKAYYIPDITYMMPNIAQVIDSYANNPMSQIDEYIDLLPYTLVNENKPLNKRLEQNFSNYSYDSELDNWNIEHGF